MIGKRLSHFVIVAAEGRGGQGEVFRARDEHLPRDVAIKILPAGTLADENARRRFRREAEALSQLRDIHIATIHDFDTQDDVDFLVMEYVPGETLAARLARGALNEREVVRLGVQLMHGLEEAHRRGLVHRDLKPKNLKLTPEGQLKILDFGLAKLLRSAGVEGPGESTTDLSTTPGELMGTIPYMSPEQLREETVDVRSDLYSAGVVLYEMAAGRHPFARENQALVVDAILHAAPQPPRAVNPQVSAGLEAIVLKALEKDPELRYQTARELDVDLERLVARPAEPADPARALGRRDRLRARWRFPLAFGTVAAAMAAAAVWLLLQPGRGESLDSLAVLPFENASNDPNVEYMSDGIAESLINTLSQLPSLKKVIAWSSIRTLKDQRLDPAAAGRKMQVRAVLVGRVVQQGHGLSIRAELMRVKDSRHLWGSEYDGSIDDIVAMEARLAQAISEGLRLHLGRETDARLSKRHTQDPEAYQLYLKGRYLSYKWTREDINQALACFDQAIKRDPGFALAYAGLAEAYYSLNNVWAPPLETMPKMKAAAMQALALDPNLAEAHTSLGVVTSLFEWNWSDGAMEYKRALELNPGNTEANLMYGFFLVMSGRFAEAEPFMSRARELDPFSILVQGYAMYPYFYTRRWDVAIPMLDQWIMTSPASAYPYQLLGEALELKGDLPAALETLLKARSIEEYPWLSAALARVYAKLGKADEARRILAELDETAKTRYVATYSVATVHWYLGEKDRAFADLNKACEERSEDMTLLNIDPRMDALRSDPRFQELLRRVGFAN